jgi:hypothetical protein
MSFIIRRSASSVASVASAAKNVTNQGDRVLKKGARRDPELYV